MQPLHVVLLQNDSGAAQLIASALANTFTAVRRVQSLGELRSSIAKHCAGVAILDMEAASISDVEHLSREFPTARIVCTHRLADEDMWTAAVNAGAADIFPPSDTRGILRAALQNASLTQTAAA
jgi:DNA-binding NtrC family response regulator